MKKYLYMCVSKDEYELPIAVAETRKELGQMLGVSPITIANSITRQRKNGIKSRYVRVELEKEDKD